VDRDKDGTSACFDSNDMDPCEPVDCDFSLGIGCDLTIKKHKQYEYCHFDNILNPEKSVFPLTIDLEDIEGYTSYNWSNGDTTSIALVNPIVDTKYYVTVSDQSGCILTDSIDLIVHFIPEIEIDIQHIGCDGEQSILTLYSPIGDNLSNVELSIDGGSSYFLPTMDNFGNILEIGLSLGNYSLYIRHKDFTYCEQKLENIDIRHQSFFDEDEDGVDFCSDPDDNDACVPKACENCHTITKEDFEDEVKDWSLDSDKVSVSEGHSLSGKKSIHLFNQNASITSKEFDVEDNMSIKFTVSIFTQTLELNEHLSLQQSTDGGDNFIDIDKWSALTDFHNGNWIELNYNGSIPEDVKSIMFKLSLHSDSANDDIYLDNVDIQLCEIEYIETKKCDLIHYDDVDSFRDFWKLGGKDALLSTKHTNSGQFSYHLQNGNGTASSILSSSFSIPTTGELNVSFVYTAISMEEREFFALEVSTNKGLTYVPYTSWISGSIINGEQSQELVTITFDEAEPDVRIRFTCYANSQYDHVYLDDIKIEFCSNGFSNEVVNLVDIDEDKAKENAGLIADGGQTHINDPSIAIVRPNIDIKMYPNPTHDLIQFDMDFASNENDKNLSVMIFNADGSLVKEYSETLQSLSYLRITDLVPGIYVVTVFDRNLVYFKEKLIKL